MTNRQWSTAGVWAAVLVMTGCAATTPAGPGSAGAVAARAAAAASPPEVPPAIVAGSSPSPAASSAPPSTGPTTAPSAARTDESVRVGMTIAAALAGVFAAAVAIDHRALRIAGRR